MKYCNDASNGHQQGPMDDRQNKDNIPPEKEIMIFDRLVPWKSTVKYLGRESHCKRDPLVERANTDSGSHPANSDVLVNRLGIHLSVKQNSPSEAGEPVPQAQST